MCFGHTAFKSPIMKTTFMPLFRLVLRFLNYVYKSIKLALFIIFVRKSKEFTKCCFKCSRIFRKLLGERDCKLRYY
jgi:hypothetical protein